MPEEIVHQWDRSIDLVAELTAGNNNPRPVYEWYQDTHEPIPQSPLEPAGYTFGFVDADGKPVSFPLCLTANINYREAQS